MVNNIQLQILLEDFKKKYPDENDKPESDFANGHYYIQRSTTYINNYINDAVELIKTVHSIKDFNPLTYGWYRILSDSNSPCYNIALKTLHFCRKCGKEWGQSYFVNVCKCENKKEEELLLTPRINLRQRRSRIS